MLTFDMLMRRESVWFLFEKTIVLYRVRSVQSKAKNWFYKMMERWFYNIFPKRISGRKEIVKDV